MTWAEDQVENIVAILNDTTSLIWLVVFLTLLVGIFCYTTCKCFMRWTENKPWWPGAIPRQKQLMLNFLYTEEACTTNAILEGWSYVLVICVHHFSAGLLLLPVVILGWDASAGWGQLLFYVGILLELGFDVQDSLRQTALRFFPNIFTCMEPVPCFFYVIGVICHHQLAVFMIVPMLLNYASAHEFHRIACSLMLAAGFSYSTGAYKFTLDTSDPGGFCRYKVIVLLQGAVIYYTRLWLWFTEAWSLLNRFYTDGSMGFFWGAVAGCALMTFFNMAMVGDATSAGIKWLPRKMPTGDDEIAELELSKSAMGLSFGSRTFSRGNLGSGTNLGGNEALKKTEMV